MDEGREVKVVEVAKDCELLADTGFLKHLENIRKCKRGEVLEEFANLDSTEALAQQSLHLLKQTNTFLKQLEMSTLDIRKHLLANVAHWFHDLAELVPNTI